MKKLIFILGVFFLIPCFIYGQYDAIKITNSPGISGRQPHNLIWNGSGYATAWGDNRDGYWNIYFVLLDRYGYKISPEIKITDNINPGYVLSPKTVWTGSEYGVAWQDWANEEIGFIRLDKDGNIIGPKIRLNDEGIEIQWVSMRWNGIEYVIVWNEWNDPIIHFVKINTFGEKIYEKLIYTSDSRTRRPQLVWTGTEYGLKWLAGSSDPYLTELYFARLDADGDIIGEPIVITSYDDYMHGFLCWNGSEYGFSCSKSNKRSTGERWVYFARISAEGRLLDFKQIIDKADKSLPYFIEWNGFEYLLTVNRIRDDFETSRDVYLYRLDELGNILGIIRVTDTIFRSLWPAIAWNGISWAVVWSEAEDMEETTSNLWVIPEVHPTLREVIIEEIQNSGIGQGLIISLVMKLENVINSIAKENIYTAINQIEAFQNEVQAQSGKEIPIDLAERWIDISEDIIQALEDL